MAGKPPFSELAGSAYQALIEAQLTEERSTKSSIEQRGALVITTAGGFATLLLGLASVVTSTKAFTAPHNARVLLAIALGFFFVAALGGIGANLPWGFYIEIRTDELLRLTSPDLWAGDVSTAERRIAEAYADVIGAARKANGRKAKAVIVGFASEVCAVGLLCAAIGVILV